MADIVDPATRSRMMAGIRGKNTKPEIILRKALHKRGLRYSLHTVGIPGKPDLLFRSRRAVVFVHGCFWHGHDCKYFRLPSTRPEFWRQKLSGNRARDARVAEQLETAGWRQLVLWECATRGATTAQIDAVADSVAAWLRSEVVRSEIRGADGGS